MQCSQNHVFSPLDADLHKSFYSLYSFYYFILTHAPHPPPRIPSSSSKFPRFLLSKMEVPRIQPFHPQKPINTTARGSISQRRKPQKPTQHSNDDHCPNNPQNSLIVFINHHRRTNRRRALGRRRSTSGSGSRDDDAWRYRAVETAGEEELG